MPRKAQVHVEGKVQIRQRGRWWQARYTTPAGRVNEALKVTSVEEARKKARAINAMLERGEFVALQTIRQGRRLTFGALVDEFETTWTGWGPRTRAGAAGLIKALRQEWGGIPVDGITPRIISAYLARRRDADALAATTCNRYLSFLRRLFDCAVRWGHLATNPAAPVRYLREESKIPEALTEPQLAALLAELPDHARPVVEFAAETGMRRSEVAGLSWRDVRFDDAAVVVRHSKTGEFRVIPLSTRALELLKTLRVDARKARVVHIGDPIFGPVDVKKALAGAGKRAGLGHVHFHMMRHTFATRLRDNGVPLDRIKELLGHKSMVMVLRYAKARPEQLRDAIATLNASAGPGN